MPAGTVGHPINYHTQNIFHSYNHVLGHEHSRSDMRPTKPKSSVSDLRQHKTEPERKHTAQYDPPIAQIPAPKSSNVLHICTRRDGAINGTRLCLSTFHSSMPLTSLSVNPTCTQNDAFLRTNHPPAVNNQNTPLLYSFYSFRKNVPKGGWGADYVYETEQTGIDSAQTSPESPNRNRMFGKPPKNSGRD
eukprot:1761875-Amphidinium_carterae.1